MNDDRIIAEMIRSFEPASEIDVPSTMLLTTDEIIAQMAPIVQVDKNELSRALFDAGFRFIYNAETWRWMLKLKE